MKNLGRVHFQLNNFKEAFNYFSQALQIDETDASCLFNRAKAHFELQEFEECIIDCEESLNITANWNVKYLIAAAELSIKRRAPKLPHQTLGIPRNFTFKQANEALHKLSLLFNPDNRSQVTFVDKLKLSRKFREIQSAHEAIKNS